ncbi:MAG: lipocalin-like domain-containing protein [Pseudomonadota bacterium]
MRLVLILLLLGVCGCSRDSATGIDVADALGGVPETGFARAMEPRTFSFPEDHYSHPDYRNEWWYLTGQLEDKNGARFGYQLTFFRIALAPKAAVRDSAWATRQLWMAHAALSDIDAQEHRHEQRFARAALGLAGQSRSPFRVWLEDWTLVGGEDGEFPWTLEVESDDFSLALTLTPERAPVLQGKDGLSQKSAEAGNASYYYSITRLETAGELRSGDLIHAVDGRSWLDREWSTSALGDDQIGWDWFSLQLSSGADLMLYRLRERAGGTDPHSAGSILAADDRRIGLGAGDFELDALRWWTSPDGARYPVAWRLRVPGEELDLRVEALLDDQEMRTSVSYWEGAVGVWPFAGGESIGRGYLEMTGY